MGIEVDDPDHPFIHDVVRIPFPLLLGLLDLLAVVVVQVVIKILELLVLLPVGLYLFHLLLEHFLEDVRDDGVVLVVRVSAEEDGL